MRLYLMIVNPRTGLGMSDVESFISDLAWYRIAHNAWVVYSGESASLLADRVKPVVDPGGTSLVVRVDPSDHQGWMNQKFWDWFNARSAMTW